MNKKSSGFSSIPISTINLNPYFFIFHITNIINQSIDNCIFPESWKISEIHPKHKKGGRLDIKNYRPISILPNLSKIIEKTISNQLTNYLNEKNLLYKYQSGFRSKYSTQSACLLILNNIYIYI